MELGIYTFAELTDDEVSAEQRLRDLLEEIELADELGLDVFGYDLADYDRLFAAKLERLLEVRARDDLGVYPRPLQEPLPVWIAVGGTPRSALRAGELGLQMALGIIGGLPERFVPFAELHRQAADAAGHGRVALSINSHGYVADTTEAALDESYPYVAAMMDKIGRERRWPPHTRADYADAATLRGANFVGNPEQVVEKILYQHELFAHDRFLVQFSVGTMPHAKIMRSIELFGTEVAPAVRRELATVPS